MEVFFACKNLHQKLSTDFKSSTQSVKRVTHSPTAPPTFTFTLAPPLLQQSPSRFCRWTLKPLRSGTHNLSTDALWVLPNFPASTVSPRWSWWNQVLTVWRCCSDLRTFSALRLSGHLSSPVKSKKCFKDFLSAVCPFVTGPTSVKNTLKLS